LHPDEAVAPRGVPFVTLVQYETIAGGDSVDRIRLDTNGLAVQALRITA
jgi:hypothetical protein